MLCRTLCHAFAAALLVTSALAASAAADDTPYWPSEIERRLNEVDAQVIDMQRKLRAARHGGDNKAVEKLEGTFRNLQRERGQLLRASGRLQSN